MSPGEKVRLKLTIHYDGAGFYGWQIQPEQRTVQGALQAAAEELTQIPCMLTGSGRTDRGVHATGQVASLEVPEPWTAAEFRKSMNAILPGDIWISESVAVDRDFHPRFHALRRTYHYRVGFSPEAWSPFHRPWCWTVDDRVDESLLHEAAELIPGEGSFGAFAKAGQEHRGERCRVDEARWEEWELGLVFVIVADRYLHHMVRYLVGTMMDVGRERRPLDEMRSLLTDEDSTLVTSRPAPARGLFLARVEYPADYEETKAAATTNEIGSERNR